MPRPRHATVFLVLLAATSAAPGVPPDTLPAELPLGVPAGLDSARPIPADNPLTEAKVRLGRRLFFDPILSSNGSIACASCHQPAHGFSSPTALAPGVGGKLGRRNVPSLLNRAYGKTFFWDGRDATLEAQSLRPIESPAEMGNTIAAAVKRLQAHPAYPALFREAFGEPVSASNLAKAIASFERVLLSGNSRVDRFRAGDVAALNPAERHGLWLYESSGRCWQCHSGPNFSDETYHNTGVSWGQSPIDLGRYEITKQEADRGRFKTPTLRALTATGPYMHDGSFKTLEEVVEYYNRGGGKNPHLDPIVQPLGLSKEDVHDLAAFLAALSDSPAK